MQSEIVAIIDSADHVIGQASRADVRAEGLRHRVTYILVFNAQEQLLLQTRTDTKDFCPGYFDAAAGGVVLVGESYEVSAERELGEELGLKEAQMEFQFDHYFDDGHNRCWGRVFICQHDGPFRLQASEVKSAQFVDVSRVLAQEFRPITPDTFSVLERLYKIKTG